MDFMTIINHFYRDYPDLKTKLLAHSSDVCRKALEIADRTSVALDRDIVTAGAMLHDIGIFRCHAPSILCVGDEPYLRHGLIGGELLRAYGKTHSLDLTAYARICERHTGSGITAKEIAARKLPLPAIDLLPETPEEKLVCLADKFFSKSGDGKEKSLAAIEKSLAKFGPDTLTRFQALIDFFGVDCLNR